MAPRLLFLAALVGILILPAGASAGEPAYVPGRVVVGLRTPAPQTTATVRAAAASAGIRSAAVSSGATTSTKVLELAKGETVKAAVGRLRGQKGVAYAVPDYVARAAGRFYPNDPGFRRGWRRVQWNFLAGAGVNALAGWRNDIRAGRPGGKFVRIAVLDTGIAYRNFGKGRPMSPDFRGTRFVEPYDFVDHDTRPYDYYGHGTHVAGTIAEQTNNRVGVTGLAYGASIMPVRVLDSEGFGDASVIAQGIRYAVHHHAQIINLSLEFPSGSVTAADIPDVLSAIRYADERGVLVVAAAGNEGDTSIAYPARSKYAMAVGATTATGCLAGYSNTGSGLEVVAPGGGKDAHLPYSYCHPSRAGKSIFQMTFTHGRRFGLPDSYRGTSMSVPHVTGVAALTIASGVIGHHPSPAALESRLEQTARDLGPPGYDTKFGYGLVDAGAATSSG